MAAGVHKEDDPAACVPSAVQFVVEAAVEPGDPHQREHHGELGQFVPGEVPGELVGGLRHQYDD